MSLGVCHSENDFPGLVTWRMILKDVSKWKKCFKMSCQIKNEISDLFHWNHCLVENWFLHFPPWKWFLETCNAVNKLSSFQFFLGSAVWSALNSYWTPLIITFNAEDLPKKIWFHVTKFSVNTISSERSHLEDLPNVNVHWTFTLGFENSKNCFLELIQTPTYSCYTARPDSALWLRLYDCCQESQSQGGVCARGVRVRINQRTKSGTWESLVLHERSGGLSVTKYK